MTVKVLACLLGLARIEHGVVHDIILNQGRIESSEDTARPVRPVGPEASLGQLDANLQRAEVSWEHLPQLLLVGIARDDELRETHPAPEHALNGRREVGTAHRRGLFVAEKQAIMRTLALQTAIIRGVRCAILCKI